MNKRITLNASMLGVVIFALTTGGTALAYKGDPNVQGPNYSPERHEAMVKAFETGDYDAWAALKQGKRIVEKITRETFGKLVEARKLMLEGKVEEAKKIREELGLGLRKQDGTGHKFNGGGQNRFNR